MSELSDSPSPPDTIPHRSISLSAARRVLDAAVARAESMQRHVCVVVCDPAGEPVVTARMDQAPRLSAQARRTRRGRSPASGACRPTRGGR